MTLTREQALTHDEQIIQDFLAFCTAVFKKEFSKAELLVQSFIQKHTAEVFVQLYYLNEECRERLQPANHPFPLSERTSLLGFIVFHNDCLHLLQVICNSGVKIMPKNTALASPFIMSLHALGDNNKAEHVKVISQILILAAEDNCVDELLEIKDSRGRSPADLVKKATFSYSIQLKLCGYMPNGSDIGSHFFYKCLVMQLKVYNLSFKNAFIIENMPDPPKQRGFHCGYYAAAFVTAYFKSMNLVTNQYPARLFHPYKNTEISLKMLGKRAGIKGVGGIFDVNLFADIFATTNFHAQVVNFSSVDDLKDIMITALKNKLPLIFPVDWGGGKIVNVEGKHAHYITIIGCVELLTDVMVIFSSSDRFYSTKLSAIYDSNINLKVAPAEMFIKLKDADSGWQRMSSSSSLGPLKTRYEAAVDLKNLRNKLVLIYPRHLKANYENLFVAADIEQADMSPWCQL